MKLTDWECASEPNLHFITAQSNSITTQMGSVTTLLEALNHYTLY